MVPGTITNLIMIKLYAPILASLVLHRPTPHNSNDRGNLGNIDIVLFFPRGDVERGPLLLSHMLGVLLFVEIKRVTPPHQKVVTIFESMQHKARTTEISALNARKTAT